MSRVTLKDAKTPLGDSIIDEANDAIRVNMVAGSVSISGADGAIEDGANPAIRATVLDLANTNPLTVAITDGAGTQITSFGGGTQYADGAARGTATGTLMIGDDGTNVQSVKVDTAGVLAIQDNGGSITVDGTFFQATQPVSVAAVVHVDDNAGSLTVDGVFFQATQPISAAALPLPAGAATSALQTQPGVDIGDVTINNAAGASAVNIQDGGNSITVDGVFFQGTQPVSGTVTANQGTANATPWNENIAQIAGVAPLADNAAFTDGTSTLISAGYIFDEVAGTALTENDVAAARVDSKRAQVFVLEDTTTRGRRQTVQAASTAAAATDLPAVVALHPSSLTPATLEQRAATLHVTATAAVNTASTCTLPAPGAGLFHYITHVELVKLYSVAGVAAAAGVIITSTNLPGNPSWTTEQAVGAAGTAPKVILYSPTTPLKSSVANTATTFVAPLQLQTIWRWNVSYFTAA